MVNYHLKMLIVYCLPLLNHLIWWRFDKKKYQWALQTFKSVILICINLKNISDIFKTFLFLLLPNPDIYFQKARITVAMTKYYKFIFACLIPSLHPYPPPGEARVNYISCNSYWTGGATLDIQCPVSSVQCRKVLTR